jgi:hypothetical protein
VFIWWKQKVFSSTNTTCNIINSSKSRCTTIRIKPSCNSNGQQAPQQPTERQYTGASPFD